MGVTASLVIFAAGAIMRFAVTATSPDFNVHTVGDILMIVGAVGFVISLIAWSTWGGFGTFRRERHVVRRGTTAGPAVGAQPPVATGAAGYPAGYEEEEYHRLS
jgi:hypothetical protein